MNSKILVLIDSVLFLHKNSDSVFVRSGIVNRLLHKKLFISLLYYLIGQKKLVLYQPLKIAL